MTSASWTESMPEIYDRCLVPVIFAGWADVVAERAAALKPRRVLELAAGTGVVTERLVQALPDSTITATDLNQSMVDWGADHVAGADWQFADAQELPFPDGSFDLVVCQFGAMFFPDKPTAFAESARVLTDGGQLLFTVWDALEGSTYGAAVIDIVQAMFPDNPPRFLVETPHGYRDVEQIRADLAGGGMRLTGADQLVLPSRTRSAESVTEGYCLGTPMRFELVELGPLDQIVADVSQQMRARFGDGPLDGEMAAIVVTATKN